MNLKDKYGLTVDEASLYTGIGRNTMRLLIKNKKIPTLTVGRKNVIRTSVLEEFLVINQNVNILDFDKVKIIE